MTTITNTNFYKKIIFAAMSASLLFLFNSCAKKASFQTSTVVPAAKGQVKVKKDKNKNYSIHIKMSNLAPSERLQPSKRTYVVWLITDGNSTKNIGQINSSSSLLSKKLKASFKTVSAFKPSKIFITAEDDADVQYPGMQVVLTTDNF